jgi:transcriptional regulator with XRE-family HTH domain
MKGRRPGQKVGPLRGDLDKATGSGAWLYNARIERGLTINDLSAEVGISRRTIMRIEAGQHATRYRRQRHASEQRLKAALDLGVTSKDH